MFGLIKREMSDLGEFREFILAQGTKNEMFRLWVATQDKTGLEIVDYECG